MGAIPRDKKLDSTLDFAQEGYRFVSVRCDALDTDVFRTRLLMRETVCMRGAAAARLFYDTAKFERHGVAPSRVQKTLFGEGGVQGLDGEAHRRRKERFMSLMSPDRLDELVNLTKRAWEDVLPRWEQADEIVLMPEAEQILCRAVCEWSGVPLPREEVVPRTKEFAAMIDAAAAVGPRHWRGRRARKRSEQWIGELVQRVRAGAVSPPEDTALHAFAWHREADGVLLDPHTAAVEVINVLRPTVAIARYIVFVAMALHEQPLYRERVRSGDGVTPWAFAQEVRRLYPFFPLVGARVRGDFSWRDMDFEKGQLVLLDLYGTNRDSGLWDQPEEFRPERFTTRDVDPYRLIPQGGGDHWQNHRCAGEWITLRIMELAIEVLTALTYEVPQKDLHLNLRRIPAVPPTRFVMKNIKRR